METDTDNKKSGPADELDKTMNLYVAMKCFSKREFEPNNRSDMRAKCKPGKNRGA